MFDVEITDGIKNNVRRFAYAISDISTKRRRFVGEGGVQFQRYDYFLNQQYFTCTLNIVDRAIGKMFSTKTSVGIGDTLEMRT